MSRRPMREAWCLTQEQVQRVVARKSAALVEGYEPTVLESRSPFELGVHAWDSTFLRECFTACPPEVWDVSTDRDGTPTRNPLSPEEWSLDPW